MASASRTWPWGSTSIGVLLSATLSYIVPAPCLLKVAGYGLFDPGSAPRRAVRSV